MRGVFGGLIGESHPLWNLPRKRINEKRKRDAEKNAPEQDHCLCAACMAVLLGTDVLRNDACTRLREGVEGREKRPENREHGADTCGCGFGSARQEPAVHHGLDHAHGKRED